MLCFHVFAKLQSRPFCPLHRRVSTRPRAVSSPLLWITVPESQIAPRLHSTSFFSVVSGLLLHNGRPQPLCLQSLPDSFHRHGGIYPRAPHRGCCYPVALRRKRFYPPFSLCRYGLSLSQRGGTPLPPSSFPTHVPRLRSASARIAHFFATTPFLATLAFFMGGRGV
jgi:hypothetical protein